MLAAEIRVLRGFDLRQAEFAERIGVGQWINALMVL
jgi:hypothetical protein